MFTPPMNGSSLTRTNTNSPSQQSSSGTTAAVSRQG